MRFIKLLFKIFLAVIGFMVILFLLAVRLVDRQPYQKAKYYQHTLSLLERMTKNLPQSAAEEIMVGAGKAGLTPAVGTPLAGYGARRGAPSTGVHDSLFIRAIALQNGEQRVCFLGYDALLCPPDIARIIEDSLKIRFGFNSDQLYFTATHSHSGPGGWGDGWVEKQFAGLPDPRISALFVDSTLAAVQRALKIIQPAEYHYGVIKAPQFVRNRLVGEKGQVDDELIYLTFAEKQEKKNIAVLVTYSAHATVLSSRNMEFSGDYPGYVERRIESAQGGVALFAIAGNGSHSPKGSGDGFEKARHIGFSLADSILLNNNQKSKQAGTLEYFRLPVEQHNLQIRIAENFRLAPWLARKLFDVSDSYLQVVKLDHFIFLASPAEFSGELALEVKKFARANGFETTITSFNGCYLGYVTPSKYYSLNEYETRLMSFLGPFTGDYLTEIMKEIITKFQKKTI